MKRNLSILLTLLFFLVAGFTKAQPGTLDFSFGTGGKLHPAIGDSAKALAMVLQPDGKILVAGQVYTGTNRNALVTRLNTDGSFDPFFGTGGSVMFDWGGSDYATAMQLQSDGKIVISLVSDSLNMFSLMRLHTNGSPDSTFDGDGLAGMTVTNVNNISSIALQTDGKIVAAGSSTYHYATARFNADGSPDSTYHGTGFSALSFGVTSNINIVAIAVQSDTKIVIAGTYVGGGASNFEVMRFDTAGAPDLSFNGSGISPFAFTPFCGSPSTTAICTCMLLQPDGKILVGGQALDCDHTDNAMARFNTDGSYDLSFGTGGQVMHQLTGTNAGIMTMTLQPDGKILAGGYALTTHHAFTLSRYNTNGTVDVGFGPSFGVAITAFGSDSEPLASVFQPDGKAVLAGFTNISGHNEVAVVRYNQNALGLNEKVSDDRVRVYPNPVENTLFFSGDQTFYNARLRLLNTEGKMLMQQNNVSGNTFSLDVSQQSPGFYLLEISEGNSISRIRVIKQ